MLFYGNDAFLQLIHNNLPPRATRKVFPKAMGPVVELLKEKYAVTGAKAE